MHPGHFGRHYAGHAVRSQPRVFMVERLVALRPASETVQRTPSTTSERRIGAGSSARRVPSVWSTVPASVNPPSPTRSSQRHVVRQARFLKTLPHQACSRRPCRRRSVAPRPGVRPASRGTRAGRTPPRSAPARRDTGRSGSARPDRRRRRARAGCPGTRPWSDALLPDTEQPSFAGRVQVRRIPVDLQFAAHLRRPRITQIERCRAGRSAGR